MVMLIHPHKSIRLVESAQNNFFDTGIGSCYKMVKSKIITFKGKYKRFADYKFIYECLVIITISLLTECSGLLKH